MPPEPILLLLPTSIPPLPSPLSLVCTLAVRPLDQLMHSCPSRFQAAHSPCQVLPRQHASLPNPLSHTLAVRSLDQLTQCQPSAPESPCQHVSCPPHCQPAAPGTHLGSAVSGPAYTQLPVPAKSTLAHSTALPSPAHPTCLFTQPPVTHLGSAISGPAYAQLSVPARHQACDHGTHAMPSAHISE